MIKKLFSVVMVITIVLGTLVFRVNAESISLSTFESRVNSLKGYTLVSQIYNSSYGSSPCYKDLSGHCSWECMAWASKVFDTVWKCSIKQNRTLHRNASNLCVGDYVRYRAYSYGQPADFDHSIFITKISGNTVWYTDGNQNGANNIRFDVATTKTEIQSRLNVNLHKSQEGQTQGFIIHCNDNNLGTGEVTSPPTKPTITSVNVNASNVVATWSAVSGATSYTVDFWNAETNTHNYFNTTATSYTTSLSDAQYACRVEAKNSAGSSGWTGFSYFWVSKYTVPDSPIIKDIKIDGLNVTVSWDSVKYAKQYSVQWFNCSDGTRESIVTSNTSMTRTLGENVYGVRVFAENTSKVQSAATAISYFDLTLYNITFDGNGGLVDNGVKATYYPDSVNDIRGTDQMVIFNNSGTTGTNKYGTEVYVNSSHIVTNSQYYVGNGTIPTGGFIVSGHGTASDWLYNNINIGDYAFYNGSINKLTIYTKNQWITTHKDLQIGNKYGELPFPLEREGYTFIGWYSEPDGGQLITEDSNFNDTTTLYARWEISKPTTNTKIVSKDNTHNISITFSNCTTPCEIIVAGYKNENLATLATKNYSQETDNFVLIGDIDTVKVMLWSNLNFLTPLSNTEIVDIK